jgi:hypothetical protein
MVYRVLPIGKLMGMHGMWFDEPTVCVATH